MFEDLSTLQIIIYIIAGIAILFCIVRMIDIARERRYQRELTEFALFCELIFFQMRLAVPEEYLKNKIYRVNGQLILYNYLAFTKDFIKFYISLGNDVSEQTKSDMFSMPLLDIDIIGELESGYKMRLYIKPPKESKKTDYIEYESDKNLLRLVIDGELLETDFKSRCRIVHEFYKMIIVLFKTPMSKLSFDINSFKENGFKAGEMLNIIKLNGSLLYRFTPVLSKEELEEINKKKVDEIKSSKGFDKI